MPGPLDGSDSESESHAAGTRSAAARSDAANAATNHLTHLAMYMDAPNHGRWTPALVVRAMYDGGWGWLLRVSTIDIPAGWPWVIRTLLWLLPWLSFGYWITVDIITLVAVDLPPPVYLTDGMMAAQVTWYAVGDPLFVVAVRRLLQSAEMAMTFDIAFPLAKQPPGGPGRDSESVHGRGDVETPDGSGRESDSDLETNAHAVTWPTPRAAPGASGPGARPRREISLARRGTRRGSTGAGVGFLAPSTWWRRALAATSLDSSPPPTALGTQPPSWDTVGVLVPAPHASSAPSAAAYGYGAAVTFWRWARLSLLLVAMGPMFNMIVSTYISAVDALDVPARPVQFKFFHSDEYQTIWGINKVNTWFTALVATIAYGLMFVLGLLLMRGARHIRDAIKRDDVEFTALSRQRGTSASARAVALVRAQSHVVTAAWQRHAGVLEAVASRLNVALGIIITSISVNAVYNLGWSIALILLHEHPELLASEYRYACAQHAVTQRNLWRRRRVLTSRRQGIMMQSARAPF